jgi:hypothetical protein
VRLGVCYTQAGPGTSHNSSNSANNGTPDPAGDIAQRTGSGTAVWDKAAMARLPTQVSEE